MAKRTDKPMDKPDFSGKPIGITLVRASEIYGAEPYYHELTAGIDRVVRPGGHSVLLRVLPSRAEEMACFERWQAQGLVDAVVLVDLDDGDERIAYLQTIGLPAVAVAPPTVVAGLPAVWTNDADAIRQAVGVLADLGHRRIGHVSGPPHLAHSIVRNEAMKTTCHDLELQCFSAFGDYSTQSGRLALSQLLDDVAPPSAVIFDNDLMALGALAEAQSRHLNVPGALSLVAWDDSTQCQLSQPPMSALSHDVQRIGELIGEAVLALIQGREVPTKEAPAIQFVGRGTTGSFTSPK